MGTHFSPPSRLVAPLRWGLIAVALAAGVVAVAAPPGEPVARTTAAAAGAPPAPVLLRAAPAPSTATPVEVRIPAVDVRSGLVELGVDGSGALVPPGDFAVAGWFSGGPVPGEVGPAVIAGHVDSRSGPAVFFRLEELTVGDTVQVARSDGTDVGFRVTRVARYPKDDFATAEVYGPTPHAELRLITCGGSFDPGRRSYRDNIVVYATAT